MKSILASNDHGDRITGKMHNCDEQHLEYWCIAHVQEARARRAKMESNNVTISDLAPSSLVGVQGVFVGTLSPVKSSKRNKSYQYYDRSITGKVKTDSFLLNPNQERNRKVVQ